MILRDACGELQISYHTLEKYMRRLSITPSRHPIDLRFYVLDDEQLDKLRAYMAQKPGAMNGAARMPRRQDAALLSVAAPVRVEPSESALRASQGSTHGSILNLELLPDDWIAFHTRFCRDHGELDPRSFARYDFPAPHESAVGWRSRGKHPQRILKAYDLEQHIAASQLAARRWPHKFKACDACLPHLMTAPRT